MAFVLAVRPGTTLGRRALGGQPSARPRADRRPAGRAAARTSSPLPTSSTAGAAEAVAAGEFDAAVCAPIAAERYGLAPLVDDLADRPGAVTRFVLVSPPGAAARADRQRQDVAGRRRRRPHRRAAGAAAASSPSAGISLTRIESRPTRERLGVYSFSLDCEGHIADRRVGEALAALHRVCDDVRFLGSYPRADGRENKPVPPVGRRRGVRRGRGLAGEDPRRRLAELMHRRVAARRAAVERCQPATIRGTVDGG